MTHEILTPAGIRILSAILTDEEPDIGDLEDLEIELEQARAYACGLLDRIWSLGHELERIRVARITDVEPATVRRWLNQWLPHVPVPAAAATLSDCTVENPCEIHEQLGLDW
jgi:hypothetical protein